MNGPRILAIDIETSPNLADVWGLWNQNIGLAQLRESQRVLCFAAGWYKEPKRNVQFHAEWQHSHDDMVTAAWNLLDAADIILHYNGKRFDTPHLNTEFLKAGLTPPSPFRQIDLLQTMKKMFRLPSNKLAYVADMLGKAGKLETGGHELWAGVMRREPWALKKMERYNKRDVTVLFDVFDIVKPWIPNMPNFAVYIGEEVCTKCGSKNLIKKGFAFTQQSKFQQYKCKDCGAWPRSGKRIESVDLRPVSL